MAESLVRNSMVNAVAGVFTTLGGFLGTVILARLLGVQGTGVVAFATWAVTVGVIVSDLGLTGCLTRFLPELLAKGEVGVAERLTYRIFRSFLLSIGSVASCFLLYALWLFCRDPRAEALSLAATDYSTSPLFWLLVGATCLTQALGNFVTCWLRGLQDFGMLARVAVATCLAQVIGTTLGATVFGVAGAVAAMAAGSFTSALLLSRMPAARGPIPDGLRRRVTRFSLETWGSYLLTAFFASRMEVFFLERSWGSHAIGLFTVSLTLSNLATQGPLLLTGALLPRISDHLGRDEALEAREVYATSTRLMALLVFPACLGMAAIAPVLLPVMYGPSFAPAVPSATVLLGASALTATTSVATVYLYATERTRFMLGTAVFGAALSILAGLTIVPAFGPLAAACGRGGVQVAISCGVLWYLYARLRCPTPLAVLGKLLVAAALCAVVARLVVDMVPSGLGVALAVAAGALTYAAAIRVIRPLPAGDIDKLRNAVLSLPRPLRPVAHAGLELIWS